MKNKLLVILLFGIVISGSPMHATVYAATKLTKGDKTVYMLADVPGASEHSYEQKNMILDAAQALDALVIVQDNCDISHVLPYFPEDEQQILLGHQKGLSEAIHQSQEVCSGLITLARARKMLAINTDLQTMLYRQENPIAWINERLDQMITGISPYLNLFRQNNVCPPITFWQIRRKIKEAPVQDLGELELELAASFKHLLRALEAFCAVKCIVESTKSKVIVCGVPEQIELLAGFLHNDGWIGDVNRIMAFSQTWGAGFDDEKNDDITAEEVPVLYHRVAEKICQPIQLRDFFGLARRVSSYKLFPVPNFSSSPMGAASSSSPTAIVPEPAGPLPSCSSRPEEEPAPSELASDFTDATDQVILSAEPSASEPVQQQTTAFSWFNKPVVKMSLGVVAVISVAAIIMQKTGFGNWLRTKLNF